MRRQHLVLAFACLVIAPAAAHAQWAIIGDQRALEGKTIIDVGTITARTRDEYPPVRVGSTAPSPLPRHVSFLEFRGSRTVCFDQDLSASAYEVAAFLVREQGGPLQLAILRQGIGAIEVKLRPVEPIVCP